MKYYKLLIASAILAVSSVANAATTLPDFNLDFVGISGGSLSGSELDNWALGEDINIEELQISGANGMVPGTVRYADITGGVLNFDTEANTFVITGAVAELEIADVNTVLFSSSLYEWTFQSSFMDVFTASGTGLAGADLLTALGESNANPFAFGGFTLESRDGFINSTDYLATSTGPRTPEVPIPAAAWLFGSGLIGLAGVARRRSV